jgi:hypothetical protein
MIRRFGRPSGTGTPLASLEHEAVSIPDAVRLSLAGAPRRALHVRSANSAPSFLSACPAPDAGQAGIRINSDSGIRQKCMSGIPSTQPSDRRDLAARHSRGQESTHSGVNELVWLPPLQQFRQHELLAGADCHGATYSQNSGGNRSKSGGPNRQIDRHPKPRKSKNLKPL